VDFSQKSHRTHQFFFSVQLNSTRLNRADLQRLFHYHRHPQLAHARANGFGKPFAATIGLKTSSIQIATPKQ